MNPRIGLSRRNFVTGATASAVIATPRISAAAGPTIRVQPDNDLQDIPLSIRLSGFFPRQLVMVTAEMVTRDHFRWRSAAMFVVGADGEVDVGTTAPVGGFYSGVSPMGLIWSMEGIGRPESEAPTTSVRLPVTVTFRAEARNGERAEASVIRALVGPGVTSKPLAEDGLLGVWYLPPGDGPHPAVIVLGGSEGGLPGRSAAPLLASHGYATLALAYFGLPGLPRGLVNIPLEYFGRAIAHVRATIAPRNDFVAVHGGSRGGELALLVASLSADIRAVVAVVPSGVVSGAIGPSEFGDSRPRGAWTLGGSPYPACGKTIAMTIRGSLRSNLQSRARREFSMRCAISTPWSAPRFRSNGSRRRSSWSRVAMISFGRHSSSRKSRVAVWRGTITLGRSNTSAIPMLAMPWRRPTRRLRLQQSFTP